MASTFGVKSDASSNSLEAQLCRHLAMATDASNVANIIGSTVYKNPDISTTRCDFGYNLMVNNLEIDTPNFIIESEFAVQTANLIQDISFNVGTLTCSPTQVNVVKNITLDPSSRAIYQSALDISINQINGPFLDSAGGNTWSSSFATAANDTISLAINTEYNNKVSGAAGGVSLLSTQEDTIFNTTYAIAGSGSRFDQYFAINTDANGNTSVINAALPTVNTLDHANFDITVDKSLITENDFGIYKIYDKPPSLIVTLLDGESDSLLNSTNVNLHIQDLNLKTSFTLTELQALFDSGNGNDDTTFQSGWFAKAEVTSHPNNGYSLENQEDNLFTVDNDNIVDNREYIRHLAGSQLTNTIQILQSDMNIVADTVNSDLNGITITENGETLGLNLYNKDGKFRFSRESDPTDRITNGVGLTGKYTPSVYYEDETNPTSNTFITGSQKTDETVSYNGQCILIPTGLDYVDNVSDPYTVVNSDTGNATAYIASTDMIKSDMEVTYNGISSSNWFEIFNLTAENQIDSDQIVYVNSEGYNVDYTAFNSSTIEVSNINIKTRLENISTSRHFEKEEHRVLLISKQLSELGIVPGQGSQVWAFTNTGGFLTSTSPDIDIMFPSINVIQNLIENQYQTCTLTISYGSKTFDNANSANGSNSVISSHYLRDVVTVAWNENGTEKTITVPNTDIQHTLIGNPTSSSTNVTNLMSGTINSKPIPDSGYTVWKRVVTKSYTSNIKLRLAAFDNLSIETLPLKSVVEYYYLKDANNHESHTSNLLNSLYLTSDVDEKLLQPTEVITTFVDGLDVTPVYTMDINYKSVTALKGLIQGKTGDELWSDESEETDVDAHFGIMTGAPLLRFPNSTRVTFDMEPKEVSHTNGVAQDTGLTLHSYSYQNTIVPSNETTYQVTGQYYNANTITSFGKVNAYTPALSILPNTPPSGMTTVQCKIIPTYSETSLNNQPTLILTCVDEGDENVVFFTIKYNSIVSAPNATITWVPKHVFTIGGSLIEESYVQGTDDYMILFDSGVVVEFDEENIARNDIFSFDLGNDSYSVNMIGSTLSADAGITDIGTIAQYDNEQTGEVSESLVLIYYRGYKLGNTHSLTYTIDRDAALATFKWVVKNGNGDLVDDAALGSRMYKNYNPSVDFGGSIGSIGNILTSTYSRVPGSLITNGQYTDTIIITADAIEFTSSNGDYVDNTKTLRDYPLMTYKGGEVGAKRITRDSFSWEVKMQQNGYEISKATGNAFQNPTTIPDVNWTPIDLDVTVAEAKAGYKFNSSSDTLNGPFTLTTTDNTISDFKVYYVVAPPQMLFTQASTSSVSSIPFTTIAHSNKIITKTQDAQTGSNSTYLPFGTSDTTLNNVTFTQIPSKTYASYVTNADTATYRYNITGSNIKVEVNGSSIYNDKIINLTSNTGNNNNNPFTATLNPSNGIYRVEYAQNTLPLGFSNVDKNIVFSVGNQILPTKSGSLVLDVSGGSIINLIGVKPYIIDPSSTSFTASKNNYGLRLYKYICPAVQFALLGNYTSIRFTPTQYQYANVSVPDVSFGSTPYNLSTQLAKITTSNIQGSSNAGINWITDSNFVVNNAFNFGLTALDTSGQYLGVQLLGVNEKTISKFTYITTPDVFAVNSADGSSILRIDANGRVSAQSISASLIKLFISTAFSSNKPTIGSNNEFVAYNTSTFI